MQYGDEKKEKLNELEKKLYSRNTKGTDDGFKNNYSESFSDNSKGEEIYVKDKWESSGPGKFDELASKVSFMANKKSNFINKILIFSVFFFLIAIGISAFIFLGGGNMISSRNVEIEVVGPISVGGGQEVSFDINILNANNVDLSSASLLIEYPSGTKSPTDLSKELDREKFAIDSIKSGQKYTQNIKAVFFGEKESVKEIKISLEYRVENSSALFYKEKVYEVSISSAPVIITPIYPKEINSGQEVVFEMEIVSNSKDKIDNFLVKNEYPFGFVFKSASPTPSFGDNTWSIKNFNPGEKRKIRIVGSILGQDNEEKVFRISSGTANPVDEREISVLMYELVESVLIKKSFIGLDLLIEGSSSDYVAKNDDRIDVSINLINNLASKIYDLSIESFLSGGAFNEESVSVGQGGFFSSSNDSIVWDKKSILNFGELSPGSSSSFNFSLVPNLNIRSGSKPEINISVVAKALRVNENGSVEEISSVETRKIILATDLTLFSKVVRSIGNIENYGPIPPVVDTKTSYTIMWKIKNSLNQVSNVEVKASLPSYVKWTGEKYPSSENINYNESLNQIVWNVGSVFSNSSKEVQFQIEILPSISQTGQSPLLLNEASVGGVDKITGSRLDFKVGALDTKFSSDPSYKLGDEKVTK